MEKTGDTLGAVMFTEAQIRNRVRELGQQITTDYQGQQLLMVCILKGACIFFGDLVKQVALDVRMDFMAVSSYGSETESTGKIKINKELDFDIEGKNVLIVEDIIDSGLTLTALLETLRRRRPNTIRICTLLDKPERRKTELKADYVGFEVENKFIVGYGLDFDEKYRQLPYITCLEE